MRVSFVYRRMKYDMANDRVLGVDIGSHSVKIAQVLLGGDSPHVEAYTSVAVPREVVVDGKIVSGKSGVVVDIIRQALETSNFSTKDAVLGLNSSSSVFFRRSSVPAMDQKTLTKALPNIVDAEGSGLQVDEFLLDFSVLGREENGKLSLMLYLAQDEYAGTLAMAAEEAGLNVIGTTPTSLATLSAVEINPYAVGTSVILDIGADVTSVLLHRKGVPTGLFLDSTGAGHDANKAIADVLSSDPEGEDTESYKVANHRFDADVQEAIAEYGAILADKLTKFFDSHTRNNPGEPPVDSITLVGGGSFLQGLVKSLQNTFTVPIQYGTPDPRLSGDLSRAVLHLAAIGLATGVKK